MEIIELEELVDFSDDSQNSKVLSKIEKDLMLLNLKYSEDDKHRIFEKFKNDLKNMDKKLINKNKNGTLYEYDKKGYVSVNYVFTNHHFVFIEKENSKLIKRNTQQKKLEEHRMNYGDFLDEHFEDEIKIEKVEDFNKELDFENQQSLELNELKDDFFNSKLSTYQTNEVSKITKRTLTKIGLMEKINAKTKISSSKNEKEVKIFGENEASSNHNLDDFEDQLFKNKFSEFNESAEFFGFMQEDEKSQNFKTNEMNDDDSKQEIWKNESSSTGKIQLCENSRKKIKKS